MSVGSPIMCIECGYLHGHHAVSCGRQRLALDRQLMADMLLALNWARVVLKNRDRSEWEQRGYADLCSVVARAEVVADEVRTAMQCLSTLRCGYVPTEENPVCRVCRDSHESYARRVRKEAIQAAIRRLRDAGYVVHPS